MAEKQNLRRALDQASTLRLATEYRATLQQLKAEHGHTIARHTDGAGEIERFNCFAYALAVWDQERYRALVDKFQSSALINSGFVECMLEDGILVEVSTAEVRAGDIALYIQGTKVKHAGVLVSAGAEPIIRSKWGGNEVHQHGLWELPAEHGDRVRFFRQLRPEITLERLEAAFAANTRPGDKG
jgi:hypothetical protein